MLTIRVNGVESVHDICFLHLKGTTSWELLTGKSWIMMLSAYVCISDYASTENARRSVSVVAAMLGAFVVSASSSTQH